MEDLTDDFNCKAGGTAAAGANTHTIQVRDYKMEEGKSVVMKKEEEEEEQEEGKSE